MIILISAIGQNNEIGLNNKLLWKQKSDMKRFKELTTNNIVVMGLNTFKSLDSKPLKDRINVVLSNEKIDAPNVLVYDNFNELLKFCEYHKDKKVFIIGGQAIYNLFIRYADLMYITRVEAKFEADTFFPKIDTTIWDSTIVDYYQEDEINKENDDNPFSYLIYRRI